MGREIRRVPADWKHPKVSQFDYRTRKKIKTFQPMFDRPFAQEAREWMEKAIAWYEDKMPADEFEYKAKHPFYWQWAGNPPDPKCYRPDWPEGTATHYQVYETVSEGTPVTPHFATKAELIDYLVEHGDEWDQARTKEGTQTNAGWDRKNAEAFVMREYAPSMIVTGGQVLMPKDQGAL